MPQRRRLLLRAVPWLLAPAGCRLVDQTTFDPELRARIYAPKPAPAAVPPTPSSPPPLLTIRFDHPTDYRDELRVAVDAAMRRKPDVEFNVMTVVPAAGSPDDQVAAVGRVSGDARGVAEAIVADGVDPGQVRLGARAEPGVSGHEVRIYVR